MFTQRPEHYRQSPELWLLAEMVRNSTARLHYYEAQRAKRRVNPPGSASPEKRAERAKNKAAAKRKKAARKASRR